MTTEITRVARRMGQLVAENDQLDRQRRGARAAASAQQYRRNELEILDCQIVLQKARIATRPSASSRGLTSGLASLSRNRAAAIRQLHALAPRSDGWCQRAQRAVATLGRS